MQYSSSEDFLAEPHKRITLMGMSNVGKTRLGSLLPRSSWFHYSVDYRLATAHLRDEIVDNLKVEMMKSRDLARHLRDEAMSVDINVSFSNLSVLSHYLGMVGAPAFGGLSIAEFRDRQARHRAAEVAAILDLPGFIARGRRIYGYPDFLNDASGSLCELIDLENPNDPVLAAVLRNTLVLYIAADGADEDRLIEAARTHPKPLYYRPEFFEEAVDDFCAEHALNDVAGVDPRDFVRWVFPKLLAARRPRYEAVARFGYTVRASEAAQVQGEDDFLRLVSTAIDRGQPAPKVPEHINRSERPPTPLAIDTADVA